MHFAGIIAEYHPFHNGHAWQIARAKALGAQYVAVALSSGAVQRGGVPFVPDSVRVQAALQAGADLVLAMPAPCAGTGAEQFAAAGMRVLAAAGCDTLVFGTESADAAGCEAAARALDTAEYKRALRKELDGGARSFAAARQAALAAVCPDAARLVQNPNDNLGVEYARANLRQNAGLTLCPLPRQGVAHHGASVGCYASATHLRTLWQTQGVEALAPYVPADAMKLYRQADADGLTLDPHAFDLAVLSRLRMKTAQDFAKVRGVSEGLEFALEKAVHTAVSTEELCDALTTSRYPRARIRRLVMDAALGWGAQVQLPVPYLHILGAKRAALPLLAGAGLPADTSLARLEKQNESCAAMTRAQSAAADLGALCRKVPGPMGLAYTQKPIFL